MNIFGLTEGGQLIRCRHQVKRSLVCVIEHVCLSRISGSYMRGPESGTTLSNFECKATNLELLLSIYKQSERLI